MSSKIPIENNAINLSVIKTGAIKITTQRNVNMYRFTPLLKNLSSKSGNKTNSAEAEPARKHDIVSIIKSKNLSVLISLRIEKSNIETYPNIDGSGARDLTPLDTLGRSDKKLSIKFIPFNSNKAKIRYIMLANLTKLTMALD